MSHYNMRFDASSQNIIRKMHKSQRARDKELEEELFAGEVMLKSIHIFDVELHGVSQVLSETKSETMYIQIFRQSSFVQDSYKVDIVDLRNEKQISETFTSSSIQDLIHEYLRLQTTDETDEWIAFGYDATQQHVKEDNQELEFLDSKERDELRSWILYNIPCTTETIVHWLLDNAYIVRSRRKESFIELKINLLLKELNLRKLMSKHEYNTSSARHITSKEIRVLLSDEEASLGSQSPVPAVYRVASSTPSKRYSAHKADDGLPSTYSAQLLLKETEQELENALQKRATQQKIDAARNTQVLMNLHANSAKVQHMAQEQRAYKKSLQDALEASSLAAEQKAKNLHMKVQEERARTRLKRVKCPFKNHVLNGNWVKGPVIGPGPLPSSVMGDSSKGSQSGTGNPCVIGTAPLSIGKGGSRKSRPPGAAQGTLKLRSSQGGIYGPRRKKNRVFLRHFFEKMRELATEEDRTRLNFGKVFKELDVNEDGFVTRTELRNAFRRFDIPCNTEDFNSLWRNLDPNKRGVIDRAAFVQYFFNYRQK